MHLPLTAGLGSKEPHFRCSTAICAGLWPPAGLHNLGPGSLQFSPFFHPQLSCCHFCFSSTTYKNLSTVLNFHRDIVLIARSETWDCSLPSPFIQCVFRRVQVSPSQEPPEQAELAGLACSCLGPFELLNKIL